jgi:hypothetical protein
MGPNASPPHTRPHHHTPHHPLSPRQVQRRPRQVLLQLPPPRHTPTRTRGVHPRVALRVQPRGVLCGAGARERVEHTRAGFGGEPGRVQKEEERGHRCAHGNLPARRGICGYGRRR